MTHPDGRGLLASAPERCRSTPDDTLPPLSAEVFVSDGRQPAAVV